MTGSRISKDKGNNLGGECRGGPGRESRLLSGPDEGHSQGGHRIEPLSRRNPAAGLPSAEREQGAMSATPTKSIINVVRLKLMAAHSVPISRREDGHPRTAVPGLMSEGPKTRIRTDTPIRPTPLGKCAGPSVLHLLRHIAAMRHTSEKPKNNLRCAWGSRQA